MIWGSPHVKRQEAYFCGVIWQCAVTIVILMTAGSQNASNAQEQAVPTQNSKSNDQACASLIEAIVSHNKAPKEVGRLNAPIPVFGPNFDWSDQSRVEKSVGHLVAQAEEAWPCLLDHFDDERYSITNKLDYSDPDCGDNMSVGEICELTLQYYLANGYYDCLAESLQHPKAGFPRKVPGGIEPEELVGWCRKRSDKKLYELQIDMCELAINQLRSDRVTNKERDSIAAIEKRIDELRQSKRPVRIDPPGSRGDPLDTFTKQEAEAIRQKYASESANDKSEPKNKNQR